MDVLQTNATHPAKKIQEYRTLREIPHSIAVEQKRIASELYPSAAQCPPINAEGLQVIAHNSRILVRRARRLRRTKPDREDGALLLTWIKENHEAIKHLSRAYMCFERTWTDTAPLLLGSILWLYQQERWIVAQLRNPIVQTL